MDTAITINLILEVLGVIAAIVAGVGAIVAVIKTITNIHDRNKKIDGYDQQIKEVKESIADMRTDNEAKLQEIRAEQFLTIEVLSAILDGLHQLNCNGPVTEARARLDSYLNEAAHSIHD